MSSLKLLPALCATSVLFGTFTINNAQAAPQILAVAATTVAIPMQCNRAECLVELSAICLQEFRASPMAGTEYYTANNKSFVFTAVTEDSRKVRLPTNLDMKIATARGHNAVQVSVPWKSVRPFAVKQLTLSVPPGIALVPVAIKGDTNPQTELDIELASGPFRKLASHIVDGDKTKRGTAELINLTINRLDAKGRSSVSIRKSALAGCSRSAMVPAFRKLPPAMPINWPVSVFQKPKSAIRAFANASALPMIN